MIAIGDGAGMDVAVIGLLVAKLFDALGHVFFGDLRILVGRFEILVFLQLDFGKNFELGFETQRFSAMKMDVGNVRRSDDAQVPLLQLLFEKLWNEVFEHLLADVALELLTNKACRSLSRPEAGKFSALLKRADDALGFAFH